MNVLCIQSELDVPTYWVSCDIEEAKEILESQAFDEKSRSAYEARIVDLEHSNELDPILIFREKYIDPFQDCVGFLVTETLEPIKFYPHYYPVASLWNGYNPFRFFEPIEIKTLKDLVGLSQLPQVIKALNRN